MADPNWPRVAVVGAGAVGGYFGGMLARAGAPVMMIGRAAFVEAVKKNGLFLDTLQFKESVRVEASTELTDVRGAEIVLFCVKTTGNAATSRALVPLLAPGALVVSMQNGVDNADQIRAASGIDALSAAVYVSAAVPEPGRVKHSGRGDLVVGPRSAKSERLAALFERAGVGCRISDNISGELWTKFTWNCGLNAISALARAKYGQIAANPDARRLVEAVVYEVLVVAKAANIHLPGFEDDSRETHGNRFVEWLHLAARRGAGRAHAGESCAVHSGETCRGRVYFFRLRLRHRLNSFAAQGNVSDCAM
jgi:2-dehydropantoate 2-reductase